MSPDHMIWISLALPILAVGLIVFFGKTPDLRDGSSGTIAGLLFIVTASLSIGVFAGERPEWNLGEMLPGFEIAFRVEPLGMLFALVASGLWILTTAYAIGYMRGHHEKQQTRFFACFAIAIFAALAAAFSANLFTLFIAYEVMTISTYPLVTHHGTEEAKRGGRIYLGILLSTSIAFFMLAIVWTWSLAGTVDFKLGGILADAVAENRISQTGLAVLVGLFAFGIGKAALMPFHRWLPAAMVAPTPVSALLHAVAVVKVGVFSVMKVCVYIFGLELLRETGVSLYLAYVAGFTLVVASLVAMTKDNLKARLAYSTIGQLAYITLGAMLATPNSVIGGGMHIAMHAVGKITLFFCAGAIYVAAHKKNISEMEGLGRKMPLTFAAFLIASVSIIGLPPGGGAWSKWFLAVGTVETHQYLLTAALMVSSLLNIAYLIPIPMRAFMKPKSDTPDDPSQETGSWLANMQEAPMMCVVPLCVTAIGSVVLFFAAEWIYQALLPITMTPS
ncbi:proton-conducting transporter transmembrane domain-containing protein [Aporhodopirellula aestuarii]|uniref:Monovalent cation/H+ antiporter subunit D family protein n=1 Tax=Aporhodopirellula aestuarii TaxID=2950107 RepID=A0ABT0U872_9BACT|nr:proton-conducting transporter membrane subunit [Aporhodopirellula aestuarii]MCM2373124.1 monovalent cation/H+ antiporter subunit D family protein [Aporhodopirellula aestuarii]